MEQFESELKELLTKRFENKETINTVDLITMTQVLASAIIFIGGFYI